MKLLPGLVFAAVSVWLAERVRILEQVVSSCVAKLVCVCEQQGEICGETRQVSKGKSDHPPEPPVFIINTEPSTAKKKKHI